MKNEKEIFEIMDNLDKQDAMESIEGEVINKDVSLKSKRIESIKNRTYSKIGVSPIINESRNNKRRLWKAAAVILISLVLGRTALNHNTVIAAVKKAIMFIPGLNSVINNEESIGDVFILKAPVTRDINGESITVKGVLVEENRTIILMEGRYTKQSSTTSKKVFDKDTEKIINISIKDSKGQEYIIDGYDISSTTGEWQGSYYYNGYINENKELQILLKDLDQVSISVELKLAEKYNSYEQMGPTSSSNGIAVTGIPIVSKENQLKLSLIAQVEEGTRVLSYGSSILAKEPRQIVSLVNKDGKNIPPYSNNKHISNHDEFYFDISRIEDKNFDFYIPFIKVQKEFSGKVTLKIPQEGYIDIDEAIIICGFPVDFYRVERVSEDTIRIHVDVHYDNSAAQSIEMFSLDGTKLPESGYMAKVNEATHALEYFEFKIKPDMRKITLHLERPEIIIRGGWRLNFNL